MYAKECLYNYDQAYSGGNTLVLVEGAFDVLKLDFYGRQFEVRAVALNTKSISANQRVQLGELRPRFARAVLVLDTDDWKSPVDAMSLQADLQETLGRVPVVPTPFGRKDPGALLPDEARRFAEALS
jgi:DNA primase